MFKLEYFEEPDPHIIVDDFLPKPQAKAILDEAINLKQFYKQAEIVGEQHTFDGCDACKNIKTDARLGTRDNSIVFLDEHYKNHRDDSVTLRTFTSLLSESFFLKAIRNKPTIFPMIDVCNTVEIILSRYGMCDFYNWHIDCGQNFQRERRVLTLVYYFNNEPEKFKGGELLFGGEKIEGYKTIKPKHNRLLIFPSNKLHCVDKVDLPTQDFSAGRFSLNIWLGFNNEYKYR